MKSINVVWKLVTLLRVMCPRLIKNHAITFHSSHLNLLKHNPTCCNVNNRHLSSISSWTHNPKHSRFSFIILNFDIISIIFLNFHRFISIPRPLVYFAYIILMEIRNWKVIWLKSTWYSRRSRRSWGSRVVTDQWPGARCRSVPWKSAHATTAPRTDSAARAVARWDGNVALQRWGCGRCRRRDGGGMSGCEVAVPRHVCCLFLSLFSLSPFLFLSLFHSIFLTKAIRLDRFLVPFFFFHLPSCIVTGQARGAGSFKGTEQSG